MGSMQSKLGPDAARAPGLSILGVACAAAVCMNSHAEESRYGADAAIPQASAPGTAMYGEPGAISGIGSQVSMTRVPVKTSAGTTVFRDVRTRSSYECALPAGPRGPMCPPNTLPTNPHSPPRTQAQTAARQGATAPA